MGALCSCFCTRDEEFSVPPSTDTNITHQHNTRILSFFNKYTWILRPLRVSVSPKQAAASENEEADGSLSRGSSAAQSSDSNGLSEDGSNCEGTSEATGIHSDLSEESCPTCFEGYTEENPKIIAQCSHHFHLPCIFEWQERSKECPFCRQLLILDEVFN